MIEMAFRNRPLQQDSEEAVCSRKQYLQPANWAQKEMHWSPNLTHTFDKIA